LAGSSEDPWESPERYLPPAPPAKPPTKKFLSLLFRQARKYGVGVIVATQNVTDLDYKALGQASTCGPSVVSWRSRTWTACGT